MVESSVSYYLKPEQVYHRGRSTRVRRYLASIYTTKLLYYLHTNDLENGPDYRTATASGAATKLKRRNRQMWNSIRKRVRVGKQDQRIQTAAP